MGLFDGGRSYSTTSLNVPRSSSHHNTRGTSPARSASSGYYVRPHAARSTSGGSAFFSSSGSRGIFGSGGGSSSSYYKRRPRDGYISYLLHKLQRMVKELWYYARRHPVKAFFAVVVPLLSAGGAIAGLLKQFGVRLPMGMDGGGARRGGGGYYGSAGYDRRSDFGGGGWMDNASGLLSVAKMFM